MSEPDGQQSRRWSGLVRLPSGRVLEWGTSLLCLVFLVVWFAGEPLPNLFANRAGTAWLAFAVLAFGISLCVAAERWQYLLSRVGRCTRATAYRSLGLGEVVNSLIPMRAGDALRVGLVSQREGRPLSGSAGVLALERGMSLAMQLVLLAATTSLVLSNPPQALGDLRLLAAGVSLLPLIGWGVVALGGSVFRITRSRVIRALAEPFARLTARDAAIGSAFSVTVFCFEGIAWWAASRSAGLGLSPVDALFVLTLSTLVLIVPAGPGAVGTLDAAILLALGALSGVDGDTLGFIVALRLAVLTTCVGFWAVVSGGETLWRRSGRRGPVEASPLATVESGKEPS